jgi:DNA polymerase III subunit gamma/tau
MSYLVFARKWRPKNFDEVVGQDHVTKTLKNAIRAQKIAHAYLFAGPQGVGKTSCARILAKALNCEKGPTENPCGVCAPCQEIAEGRSLDVIEIDGASNRGIDEIRTLRDNVKFSPLNGRVKVYIIDEVHMLTSEAFNALLKTLEEPPPYVKFIFATTQPQKVLSTILSRCQRFDFVRVAHLKITEKLREIVKAEKLNIADDVLFSIAKAADGSLRDAESILDQLISFASKDIQLSDVVSLLGVIEEESFLKFVDNVLAHDATSALNLIASVAAKGKDLNYFAEGLLEHYRNLMVLKIVKSAPESLMDLPLEFLSRLSAQASRMTLSDIMLSINNIFAAQEMARKLNTTRIPLEVLSVKLAMIGVKEPVSPEPIAKPKTAPIEEKSVFSALKSERGFVDLPLGAPNPTDEIAVDITLENVKEKWSELIKFLSQRKMSLSTYLKEALPVKLDGDSLAIGFPKSAVFFKEAMTHRDNSKIVEDAVESVMGKRLRIKLEIVEGLAIAKEEEAVEDTPFLRSTLDLFKGKVIKRA